MSEPALDRTTITEALRRLGDRLAYRGITADLYVFGGAAMALAYDLRRSTRDIDALFQPHGAVVAEAESVALELSLPRWWLNEQASAYVAPGGDTEAPLIFDHPGLRVHAASALDLPAWRACSRGLRELLRPRYRPPRPTYGKLAQHQGFGHRGPGSQPFRAPDVLEGSVRLGGIPVRYIHTSEAYRLTKTSSPCRAGATTGRPWSIVAPVRAPATKVADCHGYLTGA